MRPDNTAVIVVDIQDRLIPAMREGDRLLSECEKLLEGARMLEVPIFATQQYTKGLGETADALRPYLSPEQTFEKMEYSFALAPLVDALQGMDIEHVIVIGVESHICVFQGTRDMLADGFQVYLPVSCVDSRTEENKHNALEQLHGFGAHITNVETVLFDLLKNAEHPQFKAISKLIR